MSSRLRLAAVWVAGEGRARVGFAWKVKLPRVSSAAARGGRGEPAAGMEASQVCSFISTLPPLPSPKQRVAGWAQGLHAAGPYPARTRLWWWVCVRGYLRSLPRPLHPSVDDSISLARQPIAKGTESYSFLLCPGQSFPAFQRGFPDKRQ